MNNTISILGEHHHHHAIKTLYLISKNPLPNTLFIAIIVKSISANQSSTQIVSISIKFAINFRHQRTITNSLNLPENHSKFQSNLVNLSRTQMHHNSPLPSPQNQTTPTLPPFHQNFPHPKSKSSHTLNHLLLHNSQPFHPYPPHHHLSPNPPPLKLLF